MASNSIVLIGCCKQKGGNATTAAELYQSPLFRKSLAYARGLKPEKIFVLSAEHGIVELEDYLEPYDTTLTNLPAPDRQQWGQMVWRQLWQKCYPPAQEFIFLAGRLYRDELVERLESHEIGYSIPMQGLGIGEQLAALSKAQEVA